MVTSRGASPTADRSDRRALPRRADVLAAAAAARAEGELRAAIDLLTEANRMEGDAVVERTLLEIRRDAAAASSSSPSADWPPVFVDRFGAVAGLPEVDLSELDLPALGSGIRHHGALLVRGFTEASIAGALRDSVDAAIAVQRQGTVERGVYEPFKAEDGGDQLAVGRAMLARLGGGLLAVDAPRAFFRFMELIDTAGFVSLVENYLGERPVLSADKTTFRRLCDAPSPAWHQDGSFMGDVRAVNLWISLSHCGGTTDGRGLDVVPSRFEELLPTGTHGAEAEAVAIGADLIDQRSGVNYITPQFAPGDALCFDERFVHRTSATGGSTQRFAVEAWFFAPSRFPAQYGAIAV